MADDIDIEEHDVLESLRRRQMSDAVVKQEPVDEDYAESHYERSNEFLGEQWNWETHGIEPTQIKVEEPDETDVPYGKIILGSKPPETQAVETGGEEKEDDRQENYNYNMSLVLEDWGPILQASNCYCPDCQTLFATVNALDAHKMIAHSFLIAMDPGTSLERNKAIKSTAKPNESGYTCEICKDTFKGEKVGRVNLLWHYKNVHQIDASKLKSLNELKNWKICNHCNIYFPSDTALVKHLYELLPLNDNKDTDDKPSPVKVQSALKTPTDKAIPKVKTERKAVEADAVPTVSRVDRTPTPKPVVVKTVRSTPKQANSLILGSKINGVRVDDKKEYKGLAASKLRTCEVCEIEYSEKYYIKHMRKFHSDILLMKMNKLKKVPVNIVNGKVRYRCLLCHLICEGKTSARKHRIQKHPEMKRRKMFLKILHTNKIQKVKNKLKLVNKVKKPPQNEDNELVVSKSTLFKCNRCSVHFLTCYGACAHSRVCETSSNIRDWSCPQCQRVFKNVDKKAHEFQHQASNSKFKVYVVYLEMVVRILCECPYCYVCFEEYKFWRHIKFGCEKDTESFFCNECRLPIDMPSKTNHESKHVQGDFTKEDFIKIDFISSNKEVKVKTERREKDIPTPTLKRKVESSNVPEKILNYDGGEMNLFYCPTCKLYLARRIRQHVTGECINYKSVKQRISCKCCGISFTSHSSSPHLRLHRKYPNLTLSDLTFTRITDNKKIKPIPEYYPCKKCRVNFLVKLSRYYHDCNNTKSFNCQVCQKKIEKSAYNMHMRFHNYTVGKKTQKMIQNPKPTVHRESEVKSPTKVKRDDTSTLTETELPELLMKYQSLTTLWNILYVCDTCDTFTDSYDKVVEHCQNHFTNMESYGVVIMKCQICNMKFDRECYRRHLELHADSNDISRKSFKILRYAHAKLFSAEWLNFIDLPEDQKTQILTRSIYGDKSYVRMRLEQQGPPEYTLYRCKLCLKCISPEAIIHHMSLTNCLKANKLTCPICSIMFINRTTFGNHKKVHKTTHLEADSFRIVAFNDPTDADLNKKILNEYNAGEVVVTEEPPRAPDFSAKYPDNVKLVKGNKFYMFYKCADCEACTLDAVSNDHICPTAKKVCPKCGLTIASNNFSQHAKLHDEIAFSDKNVFTRAFYSRSVAKDAGKSNAVQNVAKIEEAKLFKCHCGLHFTTLKTIEKHYQNKNCSSVTREKCSHCYLVFDPNEIVNHLCKHHAKTQFQKFNIVAPNKKTLYKCYQCHVLFYDKRICGVHTETCVGVSNGTKCEECGLAFDKLSIGIHSDEHKACGKSKLDSYLVENISKDLNVDNTVLYKCKKCNLHYIEPSSARNHVRKYNHQTHQVKKCDQCSLRFPIKTLLKHVELHHNMMKIDRFRIKCIPIGNKNNTGDSPTVSKAKLKKETTVNETTSKEDLDITVESETLKECNSYNIYRCKKCKLHFTDGKTLLIHNEDRCSKELAEACELCFLKFSLKNMNTHQKQHDGKETINMNITETNDAVNEDLEVDDDKNETATEEEEESRNDINMNLYKCEHCCLHFNVKRTLERHIGYGCKAVKVAPVKCNECNVFFTKISATRHKKLHDRYEFKKEDFKIINGLGAEGVEPIRFNDDNSQSINDTASLESSEETSHADADVNNVTNDNLEPDVESINNNSTVEAETSQLEAEVSATKTKAKLYKCGDCNVYFMAQKTCYKHVTKHTPLNPKDYIECKLCGFQFVLPALQTHIKKHHADEFKLEDVLVQEYHPSVVKDNYPDYEIYFAVDKEQSALVSTSSDVNNVIVKDTPEEIENEGSEVSEAIGVDSTEVTSNCSELNVYVRLKENC